MPSEGTSRRRENSERNHKRDAALLARLGYKSEFRRDFSVGFLYSLPVIKVLFLKLMVFHRHYKPSDLPSP
jgi:hypothetical protein